MSKRKETPEERLSNLVGRFGVEVLNLVIDRHQLSDEKRMYFSIRFVEENPEKEKEYTEKMDELTKNIYKLDEKLYNLGIQKNDRLQILRDVKKVYPGEWESGFVKGF